MITKTKADEIVEKYPNFYKKEIIINNRKLYLYNYILSDYEIFQNEPISRELRGLIIDEIGNITLSVPKFFNINEIEETQSTALASKTIKKIQEKMDGSLITPVNINGEIVIKSKGSFASDQAKLAQKIVDSSADLQYFILDCWDNKFQPYFELTGDENPHVIEYDYESRITLIMVRDAVGKFIDIDKFNYKYTAESYNHTIEEMLKIQKNKKGIEGFVIKFEDETIIKIKTLDYFELHKLNDESDSYKVILKRVLDEDMDDILGIVSEKKKEKLIGINKVISDYVVSFVLEIEDILAENKDSTRKALAEKYRNHIYFNVIMKAFIGKDVKTEIIQTLKNRYNKEKAAEAFVKLITPS